MVIIAMRVLGALFLLATSIVCLVFLWPKNENGIVTENPLDPVEFIYSALLKQYSLDEDGLNSLLCNACENDPYHSVSQTLDFVESKYQQFKVDVDSPTAHDFTDVDCRISKEHEIIIVMQCSGDYQLRNVDGSVVSQNYINHEFWVIEERNKLKLCPRSCFN